MSTSRRKQDKQAPPQLVGILVDAVAMGATGFRLEPNSPHTMASFAAGMQATEIDFEAWSGREMMEFLSKQVTDVKSKSGHFVVEHEDKSYACRFVLDRTRNPRKADITWA